MIIIGHVWVAAAAAVLLYVAGTAVIAALRPPLEVWHVDNGELTVLA